MPDLSNARLTDVDVGQLCAMNGADPLIRRKGAQHRHHRRGAYGEFGVMHDRQRGGEMAFAGAGWAEQMDDLGAVDEVEARERHDPGTDRR